jgi:Dimerisation domain
MKYGVARSNLAEKAALALGKVPIPAIDSLLPLIKTRSIMSAVQLGIFEALSETGLDAAQVAERCRIGLPGALFLLRTLVWAGYLESSEERRYSLSAMARESMLEGSPRPLIGFVRWNATVWEMLTGLEDCFRAGKGLDFHENLARHDLWADYQRAMLEGARFAAPSLARLVPVKPGARKLLDIAGSHGLPGASICRKHPPMKSCVLDLPNAADHARKLALRLIRQRKGDRIIRRVRTRYLGAGSFFSM